MAEMPSAFMPIFSDSPSATTPRTIGSRQSRRFFIAGSNDSVWISIAPSG